MSTSAEKNLYKKSVLLKTAAAYLAVSAACILINKIYSLFGHGVSSGAMTYMFLYPLIGGTVIFALLRLFYPKVAEVPRFRLNYNMYNSGIAVLTTGSMLDGVFDIAGTSSPYITVYYILGSALIIVSALGLIVKMNKKKQEKNIK